MKNIWTTILSIFLLILRINGITSEKEEVNDQYTYKELNIYIKFRIIHPHIFLYVEIFVIFKVGIFLLIFFS